MMFEVRATPAVPGIISDKPRPSTFSLGIANGFLVGKLGGGIDC